MRRNIQHNCATFPMENMVIIDARSLESSRAINMVLNWGLEDDFFCFAFCWNYACEPVELQTQSRSGDYLSQERPNGRRYRCEKSQRLIRSFFDGVFRRCRPRPDRTCKIHRLHFSFLINKRAVDTKPRKRVKNKKSSQNTASTCRSRNMCIRSIAKR